MSWFWIYKFAYDSEQRTLVDRVALVVISVCLSPVFLLKEKLAKKKLRMFDYDEHINDVIQLWCPSRLPKCYTNMPFNISILNDYNLIGLYIWSTSAQDSKVVVRIVENHCVACVLSSMYWPKLYEMGTWAALAKMKISISSARAKMRFFFSIVPSFCDLPCNLVYILVLLYQNIRD